MEGDKEGVTSLGKGNWLLGQCYWVTIYQGSDRHSNVCRSGREGDNINGKVVEITVKNPSEGVEGVCLNSWWVTQ